MKIAIIYSAFIILTIAIFGQCERQLSLTNTLIWGPGLQTDIVVPARYFYIQAVDINGQNFTDSLGDKAFTVDIVQSENGQRTRTWLQVLDRHDGSYLVRFRMMQSYRDLTISVRHNDELVGGSPYSLKGNVYHEQCYCPAPSLSDWMQTMNCPSSYEQIEKDLSQFGRIDTRKVVEDAFSRFNRHHSQSLCHYVVKDNKVYRRTRGEHVGFKMFTDDFVRSLARKVQLPDVEFIVNLGDWPLEFKSLDENPLPIFSWCGSDETRDIVMPTYDLTESTLETLGRVSLDIMSVQANTGPRWSNKSSMAFWRGRDSRQERLDLVKLSRKHPDVIDAKLTRMFFFKHSEDLGEMGEQVSFFEFFKHKYQINIDGTVAAYRFPYLLAGDSVVFKHNSKYYEHYYNLLRPYEHYIPFKADLSDLLQQIQWVKDNDAQAEQIAKNAQMFVTNNLMPKDIYCYYAVLFKEYSKRLVSTPTVLPDMELVEQPNDRDAQCGCDRLQPHDEL